jgi:hypothetical protein
MFSADPLTGFPTWHTSEGGFTRLERGDICCDTWAASDRSWLNSMIVNDFGSVLFGLTIWAFATRIYKIECNSYHHHVLEVQYAT